MNISITPKPGASRKLLPYRIATVAMATAVALSACGSGQTADPVTTSPATSTAASPATTPTTATPTSSPAPNPPQSTTTTPEPPTTIASRPTGVVDEFVGVGGARMHVHCDGAGAVTIVLIAGFGGGEDNWGAITPDLSTRARVCTYARFGTGTSDPPPHPQTFMSESHDLHSLLTTIGEPGPYVVVGHSFGGAQAVAFASSYPGEVSGVVLIDTSPSNWNTAVCAVPDDGTAAAQVFVDICTAISSPAGNPEQLDGPAAFAEVSAITSLGTVPLTVITSASRVYDGLNEAEAARLYEVWDTGQQRWADLSQVSSLVAVDDTGHHIEVDQPGVVIAEISRLLP